MKIKICLFFVLFAFLFLIPLLTETSSEIDEALTYMEESGDESSVNWTKQILRVKGNGFGPERVKELGRRKILAKRAAKLDAYRNLIEVIKGVHITSSTSVEDMMLESDSIRARTEGMLKGMKLVNVNYSNDGGCEITVEVNIDDKGGFLITALNQNDVKVIDNYPKFDWVALRNELEKTKVELAQSRNNLAVSQRRLVATRSTLQKTEELLQSTNLKKEELEQSLAVAKKELDQTEKIIDDLNSSLNDKKLRLAVSGKELELTKDFLSEKKVELAKLNSELHKYMENSQLASLDRAKLQGYVQHIREIQSSTNNRFNAFNSQTPSSNLSGGNVGYTGLLIDARGLSLKPILAPSILSEKKGKIYGVGVIPTTMTGGAIVDYITGDIQKAKLYSKIGNNPLIVKGLQSVQESDVMISSADTQKIGLIINLLEQQKVAILL